MKQNFSLPFSIYGGFAGVLSTLIFSIVHQLTISNIWSFIVPMLIAGFLCGVLISYCYSQLFGIDRNNNWLIFNLWFLLMLLLLGLVSILYFNPITTIAMVIAANERPDALINLAFPLTIGFTILFSLFLSLLYAKKVYHFVLILLTNILVMLVLGLNISIIGLVDIPVSSVVLILELFGLTILIIGVYAFSILLFMKRYSRTR